MGGAPRERRASSLDPERAGRRAPRAAVTAGRLFTLVARACAVALLQASDLPGAKRDLGCPKGLALAGAPRLELEHVLQVHPFLLHRRWWRATDVPPAISYGEIAAGLGKTAGKSAPISSSPISGLETTKATRRVASRGACIALDR
jgi:hypothetical protein